MWLYRVAFNNNSIGRVLLSGSKCVSALDWYSKAFAYSLPNEPGLLSWILHGVPASPSSTNASPGVFLKFGF